MLQYLPTLLNFVVAGAVLLLFLALVVIGAAVGGRERRAAFDPLAGWAIACLPFVLLGTLTTLSFAWIDGICIVILAASFLHCRRRGIQVGLGGWGPYLALAFPFLLLVIPTEPYGWDQLSHWLPNTNYITTFQHFPREGFPPSTSAHAGYPYAFALATYWVETAARLLAVPAKAVGISAALNVLLFVIAARLLVEQVRANPGPTAAHNNTSLGRILFVDNIWLAAGLSLLLMTALSPTFLPTNSISASADNPTSVALLAIAFAVLPDGTANERAQGAGLIQLALILVLTVFLKEDNAVPAIALLIGRIVWDARTGREPLRTFRHFALAVIPMLAVAVLWHSYVYLHIPQGEMTLRAPAEWRVDLLPRIAGGMALMMVSKTGFFICLLATLFFAGRSLCRRTNPNSATDSFAVIAAAGFIGYNLFLAFAYVSIFSAAEAKRQAAVWRYETHLGLLLECAVILLACTVMVRRRPVHNRLALPIAATMLMAPIILAPVIRPDLDPQTRAVRAIGDDVSTRIAGAKDIYVVDQSGNGAPCPMIVYEAKTPVKLAECVTKISPCPACMIRTAAAQGQFIWSNGWSPALDQATRLHLPANAAYLLKRTDGRWNVVAAWPKTPTRIRGVRAIWQAS
ncbi:MAG TPA: hypothetical protein VII49_09625 [Rhizomicrobium sp.]